MSDRPPAPRASPLVDLRDLQVHFPITKGVVLRRRVGTVHAVDGVSLQIRRGEALGLVGESGSGKSTTGRAIVSLERPTVGSVIFDGTDLSGLGRGELRRLRRRFQMVFQDPYASLDPRMTVGASIAEPLQIHQRGNRRERKQSVARLLGLVGLDARHADRYPHELSGVNFSASASHAPSRWTPDLVVADEPVSA